MKRFINQFIETLAEEFQISFRHLGRELQVCNNVVLEHDESGNKSRRIGSGGESGEGENGRDGYKDGRT